VTVRWRRDNPVPAADLLQAGTRSVPPAEACVLQPAGAMNVLMPGSGADEVPLSIAVSTDQRRWVLLNVAVEAARDATLCEAARSGDIAAVVLLDGRFEHTAGLAALCGALPLDVYTTPGVFEALAEAAPTLGLLDRRGALRWHLLPIAGDVCSAEFRLPGVDALQCRALAADESGGCGERIVLELDDRHSGRCLVYEGGQRPRWIDTGQAAAPPALQGLGT